MKVLRALQYRGPLTARQVAESIDRTPNQAATRLLELHEDGFVTFAVDESGQVETRPTTNGNTGRVHRITPLGEAAIGTTGGTSRPTLFGAMA